jgi:choline dehydrogenase-like flavoprotein
MDVVIVGSVAAGSLLAARLHPEDFAMHSRFGQGLDWPISYDGLRTSYDQIQQKVCIAGDAQAEVWRPAGLPYPMFPLPVFQQGRLIAAGFDTLGLCTAQTENFTGRTAGQLLSDTYGFPVAQVAHTFGADDLAGYEAGVAEGWRSPTPPAHTRWRGSS